MSSLYERIAGLCASREINIAKLCKDNGWRQGLFSDIKHGRVKTLSAKYLQAIADYFDIPVEYLITGEIKKPSDTQGIWIPVLGRVAAGIPMEAIEDIEDYEEITKERASQGEFFALKVKGDSMAPRFAEGDVLIVRRMSDCNNGDIAVVLVGNADATVKRIKKTADGIFLIASNPAYEPRYYSNQEIEELPVTILGKVVELRAKF